MKKITLIILLISFCGLHAFPADTAKPKDGEGVYKFLLNHGRNPKDHYDIFVEMNKNKLGKNNSLLKGVTYTLPPLTAGKATVRGAAGTSGASSKEVTKKGSVHTESLFGKSYSSYTVNSSQLSGATFYLVSGHGGPDCGAIGYADGIAIHEKEYAYDIMLRLARKLMMEGATVHIIIQDRNDGIRDAKFLKNTSRGETCRGKEIPGSQKKRLQQRCDEINALSRKSNDKYQRAVFIHLDSRSKNQKLDVFFYYNRDSASGRNLARTMQSTFKSQYQKHQPDRGFSGTVSPRDLYVIKNTNPVSLFAELGNIQNSSDQKRFLASSQRQVLADWMCSGLIADYMNAKK